jgi:hypothetical protein
MNKYLEKIAAEADKGDGFWKRVGKDFVTGTAIGSAGLGVSHLANTSLDKDLGSKGVGRVDTLRKMKRDHKLDITASSKKAFGMGRKAAGNKFDHYGPFYAHKGFKDIPGGPSRNYIHTGGTKNVGILAHELGHAVSHKNVGTTSRVIQGVSRRGGAAAGLAGSVMLLNDKTKDKAWMAPAVVALPTLLEEGNANRHAYNAFKKHEGKHVANKFLKTIAAKNMVGYGAKTVGAAGALYAAGKWIKPHKKDVK